MIDLEEMAWDFVSSRFGTRRGYFDHVWSLAGEEETFHRGDGQTETGSRLGISGGEDDGEALAILLFSDAARRADANTDLTEAIALLKQAAKRYQAQEEQYLAQADMLREVIGYVRKLVPEGTIPDDLSPAGAYARCWGSGYPTFGAAINRDIFDALPTRNTEYDLLVVDRGEFDEEAVGMVFARGHRIELRPQQYRILVHALKNGGNAGTANELDRACWRPSAPWQAEIPFEEDSNRRRVGAAVSKLNVDLNKLLGCKLLSRRRGSFKLQPIPDYCLAMVMRSPK